MALGLEFCDWFARRFSVEAIGLSEALFPRPLSTYGDPQIGSLMEVLAGRISSEPLNLVATIIFLLAIIHTFCAPLFLGIARRIEEQHHLRWLESNDAARENVEEPVSFRAVFMHYLGEIEAVFGVWALPLLAAVVFAKGWEPAKFFLEHSVHFTEAVFVVIVMAIASTQPILYLVERLLAVVARLTGATPASWWLSILIIGPILGSLITEPAAMTVCAVLLGQHFFRYRPSKKLCYATLALLFCNVSIGGALTNFAAPPVLLVADKWGWDTPFMFWTFGIRAVGAVLVATTAYYLIFRDELQGLRAKVTCFDVEHPIHEKSVPVGVIVGNIMFLVWTIVQAGSPRLIIIGFLFFLAFVDATRHFQRAVSLRAPLLIGFFLAGLVIHGAFQAWWIEPVLMRISNLPLFFTSIGLSAFNDNASITYLASLVPNSSPELRYFVTAGAIAGGGLTIIANAPNPIGHSLLARFFDGGISQGKLVLAAVIPVMINALFFLLLR